MLPVNYKESRLQGESARLTATTSFDESARPRHLCLEIWDLLRDYRVEAATDRAMHGNDRRKQTAFPVTTKRHGSLRSTRSKK